ncbi:HAD-like domain-containing protein [Lipomyces japonicus]|uniref:HAD-like domain-containing protein n=1 Tax=Lipomyces japonicus TaxID=56871 RepID=UPI0034CD6EE0
MALSTASIILLDIEGTVCSISFVKDVLFPYFLQELPAVLQLGFSTNAPSDLQKFIRAFPDNVRTSYNDLLAHIRDLTVADKKVPELKALQGYVWRKGYEAGNLKAPIYSDVYDAFSKWSNNSLAKKIFIYSSGSVPAQVLLFANTERGDLTTALQGYFDTVTAGPKTESSSYVKIADKILITGNETAKDILFLSDNIKEVVAAKQAGLESYIVDRPGNLPLTDEDRATHKVIKSFDELF